MVACPGCGEENPDRFRLCGYCGALLGAQPSPQEVRKTVTVVFCDLKGSTELADRLDPEAVREVLALYFSAMKPVLERHGGTIEKYIGDAIMAVFGLPRMHEDDALRAVRAAAEMRIALEDLNVTLRGEFGVTLQSSYGTTEAKEQALGVTLDATAHSVFNGSAAIEFGNFVLRVAQTQFVFPTSVALSPSFSLNYNEQDKFTSVGFQYDDGSLLVLSEWTKRNESNAPIANMPLFAGQAWYVAGGWRFGKITPLLMLANSKPELSLATPAGSFTSESVTLRDDVAHNVALKVQITRASSGNFWYWTTPNYTAREQVNVFALGADFVF